MGDELKIDEKLKLLIGSRPRTYLTEVIKNFNDYCMANDLKERKLKGYSKKNKAELLEFILSNLSEEEKERIFLKKEDLFIKELILSGQEILQGIDQANKLSKYEKEGNQYIFLFKGFTWETKTGIEIGKNKDFKDFYCSCRIAESGGYCNHLFAALIKLNNEENLDLNTFPIKISRENIELITQTKKEQTMIFSDKSDIILSPDYEIKVKDKKVTMRWGGEHAGSSTKDLSKEKTKNNEKIDFEYWIADKVVDKLLAPLKKGVKSPRTIIKDKIDIVSKIMKEEKLVKKLLSTFEKNQQLLERKLPTNEKELEDFLRKDIK
ncbi:MAG: hypothetical protein EAX96_00260 [Candidatus Lokiarchaeota archaeon]|nr:hypothetical protein [Candidatus Lokiarchaeota archaeon]